MDRDARAPAYVGLFGATEAENGYNVYYFSPAAAKLAAGLISRYSGVLCVLAT